MKKATGVIWIFSLLNLSCHVNTSKKAVELLHFRQDILQRFVETAAGDSAHKVINALDSILGNAAAADSITYRATTAFLEKPYSDPNSVYRNEEYYAAILHSEIKSNWYTAGEKTIILAKMKLLRQNDAGKLANDFTYIGPSGVKQKIYSIKSKYTLLFFYNPECDACQQMEAAISHSVKISKAIESSEVTILAVYTDSDLSVWRKHLSELPAGWVPGSDINEYLYKHKVYDLRAIPTAYLLDVHKKVLLKDFTSVEEIENKLTK